MLKSCSRTNTDGLQLIFPALLTVTLCKSIAPDVTGLVHNCSVSYCNLVHRRHYIIEHVRYIFRIYFHQYLPYTHHLPWTDNS